MIYTSNLSVHGVALQISQNLLQYFGADVQMVSSTQQYRHHLGDFVTLSVGHDGPPQLESNYHEPIQVVKDKGLVLRTPHGGSRNYRLGKGLGAIFLRSRSCERLELAIWGYDDTGLRRASRLIPLLTGAAQPDFVIVNDACAWKGAAGVHAMGYFDNSWNISAESFVS